MSKWHNDADEVRLDIAHAIGEGRDILDALAPDDPHEPQSNQRGGQR